jgi:hypothetical protein
MFIRKVTKPEVALLLHSTKYREVTGSWHILVNATRSINSTNFTLLHSTSISVRRPKAKLIRHVIVNAVKSKVLLLNLGTTEIAMNYTIGSAIEITFSVPLAVKTQESVESYI